MFGYKQNSKESKSNWYGEMEGVVLNIKAYWQLLY